MLNKNNPATKELIITSELSNISDVDKHLDLFCKTKVGRPAKLDFTQVLFCLELKRKYTCETWLGLYRCILDKNKDGLLNFKLPHYSNFLKSIKRLTFYLSQLIYYQAHLNKEVFLKQRFRIAFVDSTPVTVCKVIRSSRHKTMKDYAQYSKSTTGWYYGFKLHLTCDFQTKKVIDFQFSSSKLDDRKYLEDIMKTTFLNSQTMFVADKGYQAKWLEDLAKDTQNYLLTGKKKSKNMKTLASQFDIYLLRIRARIESIFSDLKQNCFLTSTRSRSPLGYLFNYVSSMYFLIFKGKGNFAI